jgi:archaellum component FlaC
MGAVGDILSGIRQVILLQENVGRLQRDVEGLAQDVRRIRDYAAEIDKRVARIEGVMEGVARAATPGRSPRLPKK